MNGLIALAAVLASVYFIGKELAQNAAATASLPLTNDAVSSASGPAPVSSQPVSGPVSAASNGTNTGAATEPVYNAPIVTQSVPVALPVPTISNPIDIVTTLPGSTVVASAGGNTLSVDQLVAEFNQYAVPGPNNPSQIPQITSYSVNQDDSVNITYANGKSFSSLDPETFYALVSSFVTQQQNM